MMELSEAFGVCPGKEEKNVDASDNLVSWKVKSLSRPRYINDLTSCINRATDEIHKDKCRRARNGWTEEQTDVWERKGQEAQRERGEDFGATVTRMNEIGGRLLGHFL